jgi:hypothetical protein
MARTKSREPAGEPAEVTDEPVEVISPAAAIDDARISDLSR